MAKQYNIDKLREIHINRKAQRGIKYHTKYRVFIGDDRGYLVDITDLQHNEDSNDRFNTVEISIETNSEAIAELDARKADKCQALAWSIIF